MVEGLTANGLNHWAAKILEEARSHIPREKKETVQLAFSKQDKEINMRFSAPPEYVGFVKEAIEAFLPQMPITTQQLFQELIERIHEEKSE